MGHICRALAPDKVPNQGRPTLCPRQDERIYETEKAIKHVNASKLRKLMKTQLISLSWVYLLTKVGIPVLPE